MKKKILALCLVVVLAVTAVTGVTLAYFTDTDEEENVFTMGGITIDLLEHQFSDDEEPVIEDFEDDKQLMPGVENKEDKIVTIKNTSDENAAFVWYEWWIPEALDSTDGKTGLNNILHVNSYGATWDEYVGNPKYDYPEEYKTDDYLKPAKDEEGTVTNAWDHDPEVELENAEGPEGFIRTETVGDITYNVYLSLFRDAVPAGKTTPPAMNGVYLDKDLDFDGSKYTCHGEEVTFDFDDDIVIPVYAFGIQADVDDVNKDGVVNGYDGYLAYTAQLAN